MKNLIPYFLFEYSKSSEVLDELVKEYMGLKKVTSEKGVIIGKYGEIKIRVVDKNLLKFEKPEWQNFIGSHHWGKKTDYIPEDEIWIRHGLKEWKIKNLLNHEIIEREMMRALEDDKSMDPQTAWEMAHYYVKQMGF
jgi:hypothetical protein